MTRFACLHRSTPRFAILAPLAALVFAACGLPSQEPGESPASRSQDLKAASAPSRGSASGFAVLSAAPGGLGAVTCTDSTISGDVGSSGAAISIVQTGCVITGATSAPVSASIVNASNQKYAALAATPCGTTLTTLDGLTLLPGVYCFDAAATSTGGVLTLAGAGPWLFKIGTLGTGALTGTGFSVVMANGGPVPCDAVTWWVAQAATLTDSQFVGSIYAGAAITITRGTFTGDAFSKAAVTITSSTLTGCGSSSSGGGGDGDGEKSKCNQGVGNGDEGCDPGNSNHHNSSNDEDGEAPGSPGRKHHS